MKKETMEAQLPNIPKDVIEEILLRLPVKSVVKFKTVSKLWHELISNSFFQKLYLKQSMDGNRKGLMFLHPHNHDILAYEASHDKPIQVEDDSRVDVLAYCNGLFCVTTNGDREDDHDLFIWNPSITEFKKIPSLKMEFPPDGSCTSATVFFGLGYDSSSDDYKLARVSMFDSQDFRTEVHMHSRNNDAWKRIGDFPYEFPSARSGVFACRRMHWTVNTWDENGRPCYKITALNVAEESYEIIQLPEGEKALSSYFQIGCLDENLVIFKQCDDQSFGVWILKENGKIKSWMRIKVPKDCIANWYDFEPLCLMNPSKILLRIRASKLVSFDVKEKRCSDVFVPETSESRVISFVESPQTVISIVCWERVSK